MEPISWESFLNFRRLSLPWHVLDARRGRLVVVVVVDFVVVVVVVLPLHAAYFFPNSVHLFFFQIIAFAGLGAAVAQTAPVVAAAVAAAVVVAAAVAATVVVSNAGNPIIRIWRFWWPRRR